MSRLQELGMRLSLPCNFEDDFVETVVIPLRDEAEEVYLPVHCSSGPTGRPWSGPRSRRAYFEFVDRLYRACEGRVHLNFVANLEMTPLDRLRLIDDCLDLFERYPGSSFSLRSLEIAEKIKTAQPDLEVGPSTFSEVDSVLKAKYWINFAGSSVVTVSLEVNRRPAILRKMKNLGIRIKVVARNFCIPHCPWRSEHLAAIRVRDDALSASSVDIPIEMAECRRQAMSLKTSESQAFLPALVMLLPGHLPRLAGLADIVKLEGRSLSSRRIREEAESFLLAESLTSTSNPSFTEPLEAWDRIANCDRDCEECGWCPRHIRVDLGRPVDGRWFLDGDGGIVEVIIEEAREDGNYYQRTQRLGIAYRGDDVGPDQVAMVDLLVRILGELDAPSGKSPEQWHDWLGLHEALALRNMRIRQAEQD
jgi:hypothetical protein